MVVRWTPMVIEVPIKIQQIHTRALYNMGLALIMHRVWRHVMVIHLLVEIQKQTELDIQYEMQMVLGQSLGIIGAVYPLPHELQKLLR